MDLGKCIWDIMQKELERLKMDIKASKKAVYAWVAAILILIALLLVISGCGANNSTDDTTEAISLNQVGEYSGAPYVYLNNNMPYFTDEEKENTKLENNANNLSGGQKQRITIAQAIVKKPNILILDDSTSALDYMTDAAVRKNIKNYSKDLTTIIISQRASSLKDADKIIVLDEGNVVGIGKHKELLKTCSVYKEIALSQLTEEELA